MARIPIADFNQTIQGQTSSVDTSIVNRGTNFAALSNLGGALAGGSADLLDKRYKAETNNAVFNALVSQKLEMSKFENEERMRNPDGTDYQKNITEYGQKLFKQKLDSMPNDVAKEAFNRGGTEELNRYQMESGIYENKAKADRFEKDYLARQSSFQNAHALNPKPLNFDADVQLLTEDARAQAGISYPANQLPLYEKAAKSSVAEGILDGLSRKKQYGSALGLLKNDPKYAEALEPDKYANWMKTLTENIRQENELSKFALNKQKDNFEAKALRTGTYDPSEFSSILSSAKNTLKKEEFSIFQDELSATVAAGNEIKKLNSLDNVQLEKYQVPALTDNGTQYAYRAGLETKINAVIGQIKKSRKNDGTGYLVKTDYNLSTLRAQTNNLSDPAKTQEYMGALKNKAEFLKMKFEPLSKNDADMISNEFDAAANGLSAVRVLEKYENSFGDKYLAAATQVFEGKKEQSYLLMSYIPSQQGKVDLYNSIKNADQIKKSIGDSNYNLIKKDVANKLASYKQAINVSGVYGENAVIANSFQDAVTLEAAQLSTRMGLTEATDQAIDKLITKNFVYVNAYGSKIAHPRVVGDVQLSEDNFNNFLRYYNDRSNVEKLNAQPEPKYFLKPDGKTKRSPEEASKDYYGAIREYGSWIPIKGGPGLQLVINYPDRGAVSVIDKNGNFITKSVNDILMTPSFKVGQENYGPRATGGSL